MTSPGHTAYARIREAIVEGRYRPGQRLIEQRIAEEIELSRTPVREALRRLEAEGLVVSEPNRGAAVRSVSIDELTDLYELRARLEAYAAELAADRADDDARAELNAGISAFADALDADFATDLDRVRAIDDANHRVHRAIAHAAAHPRLARQLERTTDVPLVFQAFRQYDRAQTLRSHHFHQMIRDLIVAGAGERAGALMHEHVLQGRDVLLAHLAATDGDGLGAVFGD